MGQAKWSRPQGRLHFFAVARERKQLFLTNAATISLSLTSPKIPEDSLLVMGRKLSYLRTHGAFAQTGSDPHP
jgi:hypothetical protein